MALVPVDIDPDAGTVRVLHGEGGKLQTVGIAKGTCGGFCPIRDARRVSTRRPAIGSARMSTVIQRQIRQSAWGGKRSCAKTGRDPRATGGYARFADQPGKRARLAVERTFSA